MHADCDVIKGTFVNEGSQQLVFAKYAYLKHDLKDLSVRMVLSAKVYALRTFQVNTMYNNGCDSRIRHLSAGG